MLPTAAAAAAASLAPLSARSAVDSAACCARSLFRGCRTVFLYAALSKMDHSSVTGIPVVTIES